MTEMTTDFAKSVKIDPRTGEIAIMGEDDRCAFTIRVLDGHRIEIDGGTFVRDNGIVYSEGLQVTPFSCNRIIVSKVRYD
jgi:hypothetical protein